jgi:hypothetical protein
MREVHEMKKLTCTGSVFLLSLVSSVTAVPSTAAVPDQYIWCWSAPLRSDIHKMFYSGIFSGTPSQQRDMQNKFGGYVRANYPDDNTGSGVCKFYSTRDQAEGYLRLDKRNSSESNNQQVIDTGWTYSP